MFKKLMLASFVLAASSGVALAGGSHNYKGDYKGESMPSCPTCYTYSYLCGPYIGLSAGIRNNFTGDPVVYRGVEGTLSLGYGGAITPSFYLAGEIFGANSAQIKNYTDAAGNGVRSTWSWGGSLIPGIMITDYVMAYLRLGGQSTRFSNVNTNKGGWHVGLGGQTNLAPNWDIRAEYVYSRYGDISVIGHPQTDQFNVGVLYKFM